MPRTAVDAQLALDLLAQALIAHTAIAQRDKHRHEETPAGKLSADDDAIDQFGDPPNAAINISRADANTKPAAVDRNTAGQAHMETTRGAIGSLPLYKKNKKQ